MATFAGAVVFWRRIINGPVEDFGPGGFSAGPKKTSFTAGGRDAFMVP
jgi:hypothetical protein